MLVTVNPLPQVSFTYNPITCVNVNEQFTKHSDIGNQFAWDFGDGNASQTENASHAYSNTGFYDIQLIVTTAEGCIDSLTQEIEVRELPTAQFTLST
jgi:large repetitive protein